MNNAVLFVIATLIWGSTWLVITFQLGSVEPLWSVVYRFILASLMLYLWCAYKKLSLRFSWQQHILIALQGVCLFGINYWFTYSSELYITSALAAVVSTSIIYFNVLLGFLFLRRKVDANVLSGALFGSVGIILIFYPELGVKNLDQSEVWLGLGLALSGAFLASVGNIFSAFTQQQEKRIGVVENNTLGMTYATVLMALVAFAAGKPISFDWSWSYISSLVYLSLFGSVIAFGAYLSLLGKIGADKAGYVVLVYPVVALILSTFFEHYVWTLESLLGVCAIVIGNLVAMGKIRVFKKPVVVHASKVMPRE